MVWVRNIKIKDNVISCIYDPENSGDYGTIVIDAKNGNLIYEKLSKRDRGNMPLYAYYAKKRLKELIGEEEGEYKDQLVMWN